MDAYVCSHGVTLHLQQPNSLGKEPTEGSKIMTNHIIFLTKFCDLFLHRSLRVKQNPVCFEWKMSF